MPTCAQSRYLSTAGMRFVRSNGIGECDVVPSSREDVSMLYMIELYRAQGSKRSLQEIQLPDQTILRGHFVNGSRSGKEVMFLQDLFDANLSHPVDDDIIFKASLTRGAHYILCELHWHNAPCAVIVQVTDLNLKPYRKVVGGYLEEISDAQRSSFVRQAAQLFGLSEDVTPKPALDNEVVSSYRETHPADSNVQVSEVPTEPVERSEPATVVSPNTHDSEFLDSEVLYEVDSLDDFDDGRPKRKRKRPK